METLAFTFDDGPDRRCTPDLLDLLSAVNARATFFAIAPRAAAEADLVARMIDEGHAVGLHCDEHVRHSARSADWCRADTIRALRRLERLGLTPRLWRTPWGDVAPWTREIAADHGLRLVGWTVDTHDWRGDSAATMFAAIAPALAPGAIVLAHDGVGPGARRHDARETIALVQSVAGHARERGLGLAALA
ncbi:MAG: polysaccharide deacetylase family protein [Solirubrobacteraceae bacterium]